MKKVFTLIVAAVMAVSVNAQTIWKASGDAIAANTELINDGGLVIKTVYGSTGGKSTVTINDVSFTGYFQLRVNSDLSDSDPVGAEKEGSTPLIVEVSNHTMLTIYGRRQAVGNQFSENDGKDLLMINQKDVKTILASIEYNVTPLPTNAAYGYFMKTYSLEPGTYTLYRKGSTMQIYGFIYASAVTIGESGYATVAAPYAVDYSANKLEAYSVSYDATNNKLSYNKITRVVEANTAVIVKGAKGDYTLTKATDDATVTMTGLKASDGKVAGATNIYCLANGTEGLGFYPVSSDVTIPANKAYLELPSTASARTFYSLEFGGATTGINNVQANGAKANSAIYSLSGQQVSKAYKGIVIVNGKKMIQK